MSGRPRCNVWQELLIRENQVFAFSVKVHSWPGVCRKEQFWYLWKVMETNYRSNTQIFSCCIFSAVQYRFVLSFSADNAVLSSNVTRSVMITTEANSLKIRSSIFKSGMKSNAIFTERLEDKASGDATGLDVKYNRHVCDTLYYFGEFTLLMPLSLWLAQRNARLTVFLPYLWLSIFMWFPWITNTSTLK